jgi:ribosomal protein S18 acetylase RimI-like enzyme
MPGDPAVRRWVGIRENGVLIACAADTSAATGVGHLSSIAVHPSARGRNLGAVVTAALCRQLFEAGNDIVTLGMYADNSYGRAMYDRLGFADDHRFTSGPLLVRGRW